MIRCTNKKCDRATETHPVENREGWEWRWDTGWLCPEHTIEASKARHPSNSGTA
jgi:hypothetical protein